MTKPDFTKFKPSPKELERCYGQWKNDKQYEQYVKADAALKRVFSSKGDNFLDESDILIKCAAINSYYGTHIFGLYTIAKHYFQKRDALAKRLKNGDIKLVIDLANETGMYSFSTKFCHYSNPDAFPIYDSYVATMLYELKKRDGFYSFTKKSLKEYSKFVEVINAFRQYYGLEEATYRQIDIMLWISGQIYFPKK